MDVGKTGFAFGFLEFIGIIDGECGCLIAVLGESCADDQATTCFFS